MFQSVPLPGEDHDAQGSVRTEKWGTEPYRMQTR